jgi:hypothetical protein
MSRRSALVFESSEQIHCDDLYHIACLFWDHTMAAGYDVSVTSRTADAVSDAPQSRFAAEILMPRELVSSFVGEEPAMMAVRSISRLDCLAALFVALFSDDPGA